VSLPPVDTQSWFFFRLLESTAQPFVAVDLDLRFVLTNPAFSRLTGYSGEELRRMTVKDITPKSWQASGLSALEHLHSTGESVRYEKEYLRKDGTLVPVEAVVDVDRDDNGEIRGYFSFVTDTTERKQVEAALVASERRARALFEGIEDIVFVHDLEGRILDANPAACRRLGYTRDELLQLKTSDLDDPDFAAGFEERLRNQLVRRHVGFEGRHRNRLGMVIPVDISTSMIQLEDQVAVLAVCRDITERKALEEARRQFAQAIEAKNRDLSESEARYRRLTEGAQDAVVVADEAGRITLFNPAAERTFGYLASEILGRPITDLIPQFLRESLSHVRFRDFLESRLVGQTVELKGLRKEGESFPLELSLSAVEGEGEVQFIGSIRDQTERQRMRAMLAQSEKLASIGLLSAGVAHEINNPLAYVANNLAVLERDFHGILAMMNCYEEAHESLRQADLELLGRIEELSEDLDWPYVRSNLERMLTRTREGVQRVANIVQNLRGLARTSPPKMESVSVPELIVPAIEMIQGRIRRRGIDIVQLHQPSKRVMCVPSQISQVVLNLLVNAIQAIESSGRERGGRIEIRTGTEGDDFFIEIADDGLGIDPEAIPKLFDPFFTTKPVGEGTGLGLSISHGIITGHGGRIEVESQPGEGTRFRIFLPFTHSL
jgi:two-component system, NtrC family, sensor kinase